MSSELCLWSVYVSMSRSLADDDTSLRQRVLCLLFGFGFDCGDEDVDLPKVGDNEMSPLLVRL